MTPLKGLVALTGVVVLVVIFVALGYWLSLTAYLFGGSLFILYWASFKGMARSEFFPALLGAIGGLGVAFAVLTLPAILGPAGLAIAVGMIVGAIYLDIIKACPLVFNNAFMIYLTLGTIPVMNNEKGLVGIAMTLGLATAYVVVLYAAFRAAKALTKALALHSPRAGLKGP